MERTTLNGTWTVEAVRGPAEADMASTPIEAVVPGGVHTDLLRAGLIPDPFDGDGEAATRDRRHRLALAPHLRLARSGRRAARPGRRGPRHPRHGRAQRHRRRDHGEPAPLVPLPRRAPAPRGHERPGRHLRRPGPRGRAAVRAARRRAPPRQPPPLQRAPQDRSNSGRDWGVDVATSGIWKSIGIESWSGARIASVRPLVDLDGTDGVLTAHVDVELAGSGGASRRPSAARPPTQQAVPTPPDWRPGSPWPRTARPQRPRSPAPSLPSVPVATPCPGRAPSRTGRPRPARRAGGRRLVAARRGRPAAVRRPRRGRRRRLDRPGRLPDRHPRHRGGRGRGAVPAAGQRPARDGARGELDPGPRVPHRDDP